MGNSNSVFTTTGISSTTWPQYNQPFQHTIGPGTQYPAVQFPVSIQQLGPIEGLDELCLLLRVQPTDESLTGLQLVGKSGKCYSLVDIISAQLNIMEKLHVLLVHRDLTQEPGE